MVELEFVRTYDAPRQLVWAAWTDPDQIAKWWGPRGVSTPRESIEVDLRPGGRIRFDMVDDATGTVYPNSGTVLEIEPPARIVWADDGFPDRTGNATATATASLRSTRRPPGCGCTSRPTSPSRCVPGPRSAGAASSTGSPSSWRTNEKCGIS